MKLHVKGGARIDGETVRDGDITVEGETLVASDGPVTVVIDPEEDS